MPDDPRFPAPGEISDDEFLRKYGVGANLPPGTPAAVQPPTSTSQFDPQNILQRYGGAAARGAAWNAPFAGVTALTGAGVPLAAGELAIGALGGIAGQAAHDLGAPAWVEPTIGAVAGLGAGGVPTVARGLGQVFRGGWHAPLGQAAIIAAGDLAANILSGAAHVSADAGQLVTQGLAAAAGFGTAAVVQGTRSALHTTEDLINAARTGYANPLLYRQTVRDLGLPFAGAVGGAEGPSATAPVPPARRSTLELSPDQPGR